MSRPSKHSAELRERPVRMVFDHTPEHPSQWAAILSVGEKLGNGPSDQPGTTEAFEVHPSLFGENLTVQGIDRRGALVGERWRVGTALLEVAQPRLPCFKLGLRVGDAGFSKRFQAAIRPGAYLRVIEDGVLQAGDSIHIVARPNHGVTMAMMVESLQDRAKALGLRAATQLPAWWHTRADALFSRSHLPILRPGGTHEAGSTQE